MPITNDWVATFGGSQLRDEPGPRLTNMPEPMRDLLPEMVVLQRQMICATLAAGIMASSGRPHTVEQAVAVMQACMAEMKKNESDKDRAPVARDPGA